MLIKMQLRKSSYKISVKRGVSHIKTIKNFEDSLLQKKILHKKVERERERESVCVCVCV